MFGTGVIGFIVGMVVGAVVNRVLLRRVPRTEWRANPDIKLYYGALNWAFGIGGIFTALYLEKWLAP